jgi:hypothetical protein
LKKIYSFKKGVLYNEIKSLLVNLDEEESKNTLDQVYFEIMDENNKDKKFPEENLKNMLVPLKKMMKKHFEKPLVKFLENR